MKKLLLVLIILAFHVPLLSQKMTFNNGSFTYNTVDKNMYYNGIIIYGDFKIPYNTILHTVQGDEVRLQFSVTKSVSGVLKNADLLPGSTGTVWVKKNEIINITIDRGVFGKIGSEGIPLNASVVLKNNNVEKIENGFFEISDYIKLDLSNIETKNLQDSWGGNKGMLFWKKPYYYNKSLSNEFSYDVGFLNLKPKLKLNGELNISPSQVYGKGRAEISVFKEKIVLGGHTLPLFLTEGNPYYLEGEFSYNNIHKYLKVTAIKGMKSGNIDISGEKSISVILEAKKFGLKAKINGNVKYDLSTIGPILESKQARMNNLVDKLPHNTPIDEKLFVWALQFYKDEDSIIKEFKKNNKLDLNVNLYVVAGYDPDEIVAKGNEKQCTWNLIKIDIDFENKNIFNKAEKGGK